MNAILLHDYLLAVEPGSTPRYLVPKKKTWRDSLPIDMLLSAVSVLVVAQSSSEIPEGLKNNPVDRPAQGAQIQGTTSPRRLIFFGPQYVVASGHLSDPYNFLVFTAFKKRNIYT